MEWMAIVAGTDAQAWEQLTAALGCEDLRVGQLFAASAGVPAFSGVSAHMVIQIGPG